MEINIFTNFLTILFFPLILLLFIAFSFRAFKDYIMKIEGKRYWKLDRFFIAIDKDWDKYKNKNQFSHIESDDNISCGQF